MKLSSYFIVPKTKRPLDDENERSTGRMVGNKQEKCSGNSVTCTDHVKRVDDRCLNYYIIIFYFILSASFFFYSYFFFFFAHGVHRASLFSVPSQMPHIIITITPNDHFISCSCVQRACFTLLFQSLLCLSYIIGINRYAEGIPLFTLLGHIDGFDLSEAVDSYNLLKDGIHFFLYC